MNRQELAIKLIIAEWHKQNARVDKLIDSLSDDQLSANTAPDRNSGTYLLGHLTAVSDGLFPLLGFGEKLHPELENIFLANPDKSGLPKPGLNELKQQWKDINAKLTQHFDAMQPDDWFARHNAVSEEDFAKEPNRNKLNILINRTNHQSYHLGQMTYLKS